MVRGFIRNIIPPINNSHGRDASDAPSSSTVMQTATPDAAGILGEVAS